MDRRIIFYSSGDGTEGFCPFCSDLIEACEEEEIDVPFEYTTQKICLESMDSFPLKLAEDVTNKINPGKKNQISTPIFINGRYANISTRGKRYFEGMIRRILQKWKVVF